MGIKTLCLGVLLIGCSDRPPVVVKDSSPPPPPPPTQPACERDGDCTEGWQPTENRCGPVARCVAKQCVDPPAMTGVAGPSTGQITFETTPETTYQVEVVDDRFEVTRGLMCRSSMKPDWGMLFLMENTRVQRFWMKNTLIPLDMVFIDSEWTVVGAVSAEPLTLSGRGVAEPSRFVLELNVDEARKRGIVPGVKARFYPPTSE